MKQVRPLSPHLQIYKPQITLSIMHRLTGIGLSVEQFNCFMVNTLSLGESFYEYYIIFVKSVFGKLILIAFTFALSYHLSNGIRHLFWDLGYGFELEVVFKSGVVVIFSALVLTSLVWIYILF